MLWINPVTLNLIITLIATSLVFVDSCIMPGRKKGN